MRQMRVVGVKMENLANGVKFYQHRNIIFATCVNSALLE